MGPAGDLYGITYEGGASGDGVVFELTRSGAKWKEQVIYTIEATPSFAGLTMDAAGNIFAVTLETVCELSPNGSGGWNSAVIHPLHAISGFATEGTPALDQAGNLYDTASYGGTNSHGTVFELSPKKEGGMD
jgi:uncharacterized repeat protein (TIGR03803 family)